MRQRTAIELASTLANAGIDIEAQTLDRSGTLLAPPKFIDILADIPLLTRAQLRILDRIGEGGMAVIDRAIQNPLAREVAIKRSSNREASAALVLEAQVTGYLEHPNIVPIHALGKNESGEVLLIMKRIEGVSWEEMLGGDLERDLDILDEVCRAIHFAHEKGVLHRDLKPENIMLGPFGEVYVLDWGIAVSLGGAAPSTIPESRMDSIAGTPSCMAPEMVDPTIPLDRRTDVYLLGALLFALLTGRPPHTGNTLLELLFSAFNKQDLDPGDDVPLDLRRICRRATARDPSSRYDTADEFRRALQDFRARTGGRRMVEVARARLQQLVALTVDEEHDAVAARAYHESRFGFEQVLSEWPDFASARAGLSEAHIAMARRELGRGRLDMAEQIAAFLPVAPSDLLSELAQERQTQERLANDRAEQERALAAFREAERQRDVHVGQRARAIVMMGVGVGWCGLTLVLGVLERAGRFKATNEMLFLGGLATLLALSLALVFRRRRLLETHASRALLVAIYACILSCVAVCAFGVLLPLRVSTTMGLAHVVMWAAVTTAAPYDHRIMPAVVLLPLGFLIPWLPGMALEANGIIILLVVSWIAHLVRRAEPAQE